MNWSVLLGLHGNERKNEAVQFSKTEPLHLFICDELSTVLTQLERDNAFKLIILDKRLFATEGDSVLRVISRLHPQTPVILLGENSGESLIPSEDNPLYEVPSHLSFPDLFSSVRKLLHDSKGG